MLKRTITALVALCVFVPIILFADYEVLPIAVAFASVVAVYEMLGCIGLKKSVAVSVPLYLAAVGMPFAIRHLDDASMTVSIAVAAALVILLYFFAVLIFSRGKYQLPEIGVCYFTMTYILVGFNALIWLHDREAGGQYVYLIAFIGAWMTDIFAYFSGRLFGKHKLIPEVSPKKTIEGSIGGIIFCVGAMILFGFLVGHFDSSIDANLWIFAIAGLIVSIVSQIGDLSMSVVKRHYGIKDYGKLFPGHGGMLDRLDSVLAVSIVLLVFSSFFDFFH